MNLAIKITLLASGIFLLIGMLLGIIKYRKIMTSATHQAPVYIDIAHRASLLYSFAALVMAKLLEYNSFSLKTQLWISCVPLFFFAVTIAQYARLGFENNTENQFAERNFTTTWGMYLLIIGEIGGVALILWGFCGNAVAQTVKNQIWKI
jgi:hypothetical protein